MYELGIFSTLTLAATGVWVCLILLCRLQTMRCDSCTVPDCKERGRCNAGICSRFTFERSDSQEITIYRQ